MQVVLGLIIRTVVKQLELLQPQIPGWAKMLTALALSALASLVVKAPDYVQSQVHNLSGPLSAFLLWGITELWHVVLNFAEKLAKSPAKGA